MCFVAGTPSSGFSHKRRKQRLRRRQPPGTDPARAGPRVDCHDGTLPPGGKLNLADAACDRLGMEGELRPRKKPGPSCGQFSMMTQANRHGNRRYITILWMQEPIWP
jgi:hypothetical protein